MYCENCGQPLPDKARYCGYCGTAITPLPDASRPSPPPVARAPSPPPAARVAPSPLRTPPPSVPPTPSPVSPAAGGLVPPDWHWAVVLILSAFTYGLGGIVWAFRQALFVKKLDPASQGVLYLGLSCGAMAMQVALYVIAFTAMTSGDGAWVVTAIMVLNLVIVVLAYVAIFGMRRSLINYYNSVEPIGLRLSGVMTFFFSILYFQYHLSRIAAWKKTGTLP